MVIKIKSNAKINLGLNIVGKTKNNYHLLDMIMVPISLSDNLTINFCEKLGKLEIKTNIKELPTGEDNIIYKIYNLFYKETKLEKQKIELYLEKKIPSQAGLGGGSSNGAYFFNELNKYYGNPITLERAIEITKDIGADIPFFLENKPCRIKGIGEKLELIENNLKESIILIKPSFGVSTAVAYKNYSKLEIRKNANIEKIIEKMKSGEKNQMERYIENNLEEGLLLEDKNIINFRKKLDNIKELSFYMSGSGSCYYTLVEKKKVNEVCRQLNNLLEECFIESCDFI